MQRSAILIDPVWGKKNGFSFFETAVLAMVTVKNQTYASLDRMCEAFDGRCDDRLEEALDTVYEKGLIQTSKRNPDFYSLTDGGRLLMSTYGKVEKRAAREKKENDFVAPSIAEVIPFFQDKIKQMAKSPYHETWGAYLAYQFMNYYSNGTDQRPAWHFKAGPNKYKPIADWPMTAIGWVRRKVEEDPSYFHKPLPQDARFHDWLRDKQNKQ